MENQLNNTLIPGIADAGFDVEEAQEDAIDYEALLAEIRDESNELDDEEAAEVISDEDFDEIEKEEFTHYLYFDFDANGKPIKVIEPVLVKDKEDARATASAWYTAKKRALKRQFALEALAQKDIDLNAVIPDYQLQMLVEILTQSARTVIDLNRDKANKFVGRILIARMPRCVKNTFRYHPQSIRTCPGFLYQASEKYGRSAVMWLTPNMPYWYKQGTEMETLLQYYGHYLPYIDKRVYRVKRYTEILTKKQVHFASKILSMLPHGTYMNLVEGNAIWFHRLYMAILEQQKAQNNGNETAQNSGL